MLVSSVALTLVAVSSGLDVRGSATCPSPVDVAERIAPLLSPEQGFPPGVILRIDDVSPSEIDVRMENEGEAAPLASRRLARNGSCGELAEAAAVVAASWAGRYETPSPAKLAPWDDAGPQMVVGRGPVRGASPAGAWSVGGSAGLAGADAGGLALHGSLELTAAWRGTRWFGRVLLGASGDRTLRFDSGNAGWWRMQVAPSVGRVWGASVFFEASGGPVVGPVFVRGQGFSPNAQDVSLDVGVSPAIRLGYRFGAESRTAVWIGGSAVAWLRPHRLWVDMSTSQAAIPWLDVMTGVGATFDLWH